MRKKKPPSNNLPKKGPRVKKGIPRNSQRMPRLPRRDPRDKEQRQFSVKLPTWLIERLDEIGQAEAYSRNELIREALRSFVAEWEDQTRADTHNAR